MLIGEVAERSGVSARMLRHYDALGLVTPTGRTQGGYRSYGEDDLRRLLHVESLRALGLTLQEVADALADLSFDPSPVVEELLARSRERLLREQELQRRLRQVQAGEAADWAEVLRLVGLLRGLAAGSAARQRLALSLPGGHPRDAGLLAEAALTETDPAAAGALRWALVRAGEGPEPASEQAPERGPDDGRGGRTVDRAVDLLARALDSSDPARRHRAVAALTELGTPEAAAALADATGHPDPAVHARAVLARAARGEPGTVTALVGLVADGHDDVEAADALAVHATRHGRTADVVTAVTEALRGAEAQARRRLVAALADVPGPAARSALESLQHDPDRGVALTARALLRRRTDGP